jgi:hypothetical protein
VTECGDRAPRAEHHRARPGANALRKLRRDLDQSEILPLAATLLRVLQVAAECGHVEDAVESGREPTGAQLGLVGVAHLTLDEADQTTLDEPRHELCSRFRRGCEYARVHLHAGGDAEHRQPPPDSIEHVACRAVTAGEDKQIHARVCQRHGSAARVDFGRDRGSCLCTRGDARRESRCCEQLRSHRRRPAHEAQCAHQCTET